LGFEIDHRPAEAQWKVVTPVNQCTLTSTRLWYQAAMFWGGFSISKTLVDYSWSGTALLPWMRFFLCQRLNRRFLIGYKARLLPADDSWDFWLSCYFALGEEMSVEEFKEQFDGYAGDLWENPTSKQNGRIWWRSALFFWPLTIDRTIFKELYSYFVPPSRYNY